MMAEGGSLHCNLAFVFQFFESLLVAMRIIKDPNSLLTEAEDPNWHLAKQRRIQFCLEHNPVHLWELRELALSKGGLLTPEARKRAWPLLVGFDVEDKTERFGDDDDIESENPIPDLQHESSSGQADGAASPTSVVDSSDTIFTSSSVSSHPSQHHSVQTERNPEHELIRRESNRSVIFQYNKHYERNTTPEYAGERLTTVLENVVTDQKHHYYQGLHDVVGVLLHSLQYDTELTAELVQHAVGQSHFRDAMRENFSNVTWLLNLLVLPLVEQIDRHVHYALQEVDLASLCLPWVITWFTHDVYHPDTAARLADAFMAGHPLLPLYFAVSLLTHPVLKQELLQHEDYDPASLFVLLKKLPRSIGSDMASRHDNTVHCRVPVQEILEDALGILKRFPPRKLLDLVDADFEELLLRVSSISAFRTPSAWRITSGKKWTLHRSLSNDSLDSLTSAPLSSSTRREMKISNQFIRAKLASGVPIVQKEIPDSHQLFRSVFWGTYRYEILRRKRRRGKLRKFARRMIRRLTNSKVKSS
ncbi:unnamed protein product [Cylindrotheca closterium]|uniref:Rab-GAP TBC domain-containing protein n=1 Tax=Cylindrotheca closterium TaxID=2856 RepID=A0AAD2FDV8_9STRA|nr:unnamed protein product [Cylindrotheca closterium]